MDDAGLLALRIAQLAGGVDLVAAKAKIRRDVAACNICPLLSVLW